MVAISSECFTTSQWTDGHGSWTMASIFVKWVLQHLATYLNFHWKIIFFDEANFCSNGYMKNKFFEFGMLSIHMRSKSVQCIPKQLLFRIDMQLASAHISMTRAPLTMQALSVVTNFDLHFNDVRFQKNNTMWYTVPAIINIFHFRFEGIIIISSIIIIQGTADNASTICGYQLWFALQRCAVSKEQQCVAYYMP